MEKFIAITKSIEFSEDLIPVIKRIQSEKEYDMSRQLFRSGTAVGALLHEAKFAESQVDFKHKRSIALKEDNETLYWLKIARIGDWITEVEYERLRQKMDEIVRIIATSIKTIKSS